MALTQISTAGVKDDAVTSGKIPANAVGSSELADNAVDTAAIAADAVTGAKIADDSIDSEHYADTSIDTAHISNSAITSQKIADQAVTLDKIVHGTSSNDGKFLRANNGADPTFESVITPAGRNLIINGNFKVAQRATSHGSSGYRTVDRWKMTAGGANAALTQSQYSSISGTSPYAEGHHQAFRIENAGQNANTQGYVYMEHRIEAQDIVSSGWNYLSSSSYITLSFWVRASVTQSYLITLNTNDGTTREWNHLVSLTGDQWTKVTMTIPGDSNITINNDNGIGLILYLTPYLGSHYTAGSTVDQWVNHAGYTSRPDMGDGWWTTSNSTFMLTGVQLEAGSKATPFQHRSYGQELALCQRYYYLLASGATKFMCMGDFWIDAQADGGIVLPVEMRTTPTLDHTNGADYYRVWTNGTNSHIDGAVSLWNRSHNKAVTWYATPDTNRTAGHSNRWITNNASAHFALSAEL